ncbi:hypothetical protein MTR_4g015670 [Medicago truncatula]|uniref:Uncharacterized protein n=1 Tax=Medicago truncatula TaxID=3880 RepID=G7JN33_MEDTR|nr:hypothetical protein MTR_4g015670 [Medicago truncatula]
MGPLFQGSNNLGDNDKRSLEEESLLSSLEEKGTPVAFTQVELSERRVSRVAEIRVSFVEDKTMLKEEHISFECVYVGLSLKKHAGGSLVRMTAIAVVHSAKQLQ